MGVGVGSMRAVVVCQSISGNDVDAAAAVRGGGRARGESNLHPAAKGTRPLSHALTSD